MLVYYNDYCFLWSLIKNYNLKNLTYLKYFLFIAGFITLIQSCDINENTSEDPSLLLEFYNYEVDDSHGPIDTLLFDTLLVNFGSVTKFFKALNPHNVAVSVSSIELMGGEASQFRLNIDGVTTNTATDILIEPKDSVYIFAEVTIDPTDVNNPFIVEDSVRFNLNGNEQFVKLLAYGQNAHFLAADTIKETTTWTDDKPYVILGYILIDTMQTLNIMEGVNVHLYNGASIVGKGDLNVLGTADSIVSFSGTRLEYDYQTLPGQWGGIYLGRSTNNRIEYADIKNAIVGLVAGIDVNEEGRELPFAEYSYDNITNVNLNGSIIRNSFGPNIFSVLANITAANSLFYDANQSISLNWGGLYQFTHCNLMANGTRFNQHNQPLLYMSNGYAATDSESNSTFIYVGEFEASFTNCIINGSLEQEISYAPVEGYEDGLAYQFENCILNNDTISSNVDRKINCLFSEEVMFVEPFDLQNKDFNLTETSPAINKGITTDVIIDITGKMRADGQPDIGCYEFIP